MDKANVLILGGCGFLGRNLISYLISNDLVNFIRIVDKVPPQVAWLSKKHQEYFMENEKVEFKSSNLINPESCDLAFISDRVDAWDFVVNCAGETKFGQTDPVYKEGVLKLSVNCAASAAKHKVRHYVEISSGQILSSEKVPIKEDCKAEPWTLFSKWKYQVEQEIKKIPGLNYTILRPALVYGPGDRYGITTRLIIGGIYRHLGETMKLLWNGELKLNTIYVKDVCRAVWFVCNRDDTIGQIFNVVDDADSTQGSISDLIAELFNIKIDYYGSIVSRVVDLDDAADEANDKHMGPWAEACQRDSIQNTPLSPHMDFQQLQANHLHLSGDKLKKLGFQLSIPKPTVDKLKEIIDDFVIMKIFPQSLTP